jgi:hypothetical protein
MTLNDSSNQGIYTTLNFSALPVQDGDDPQVDSTATLLGRLLEVPKAEADQVHDSHGA